MGVADGTRFLRELERIRWRQQVLSLPGGPAWLCEQAARVGWREQNIGPNLGQPEIPPCPGTKTSPTPSSGSAD